MAVSLRGVAFVFCGVVVSLRGSAVIFRGVAVSLHGSAVIFHEAALNGVGWRLPVFCRIFPGGVQSGFWESGFGE
jgi:hypothetical protein